MLIKPVYSQRRHFHLLTFWMSVLAVSSLVAADPWVVYEGEKGPGNGKHIVLLSGDDEYRSEEGLPMLGKILSVRHGFKCTVLFAINPEDGTITPNHQTYIPGLHHLQSADMLVIALRFRELPDEDMKYIDEYTHSGKPILGLRTATHAFSYSRNPASRYAHYSFNSEKWVGGFGQQVLGDTWVNHHGSHGNESTRGLINGLHQKHPVLRGVDDIWGPTDVYGIRELGPDATVLVFGQVLTGMKPSDPPNYGKSLMPLVWTRDFTGKHGKTSKVICTTMGASFDLKSAGLRRLLVNACYWALEIKNAPETANVDYVGDYKPTPFGFGNFVRGVKPQEHRL